MVIFNALLNLRELKELYSGKPVCVCPLYKGVINAPKTFEATGNPIVLPEYKSLVKLKTTFSPKQAGTGDPSPENVRPISGYDDVTVNVRGKNLFNISKIENNYQITNNGDGSLTISTGSGTSAAQTRKTLRELCDGITPGTYTINAESTGSDKIVYTKVIGRWAFGTSKTLTDEMLDSELYFYASGVGTTATVSNIQLELGSTPTPYEPYQGDTYDISLPETIYGGTVDAVTGAGSKTWGYIASYNGESLPGEWISDRDVYTPEAPPTTGAQVAYKLATPESFKISQVSIPSLKGENYFFTNGENMDIIYKKEFFWGDEA